MATCYYISEGIKQLRAVERDDEPSAQRTYFRGMKDVEMPADFGKQGGVELACMSTTRRKELAFHYSKSTNGLVFEVVADSFMQRGANIAFLSIFPIEKEFLYPPGTYLKPKGTRYCPVSLRDTAAAGAPIRTCPVANARTLVTTGWLAGVGRACTPPSPAPAEAAAAPSALGPARTASDGIYWTSGRH
eukprot:gene29321-biopygen100470